MRDAKCVIRESVEELICGLGISGPKRRRRHRPQPAGSIVARYDYTDEHGTVLYQVRRHNPKGFSVRSMTGRGGRGRGGRLAQDDRYRRVPYRLVELLAADPSRTVWIVEGEKDVETLRARGLVATCNAFGGGGRARAKWTRGHSRWLRGRHVAVIPDNDPTGEEHARSVAFALRRVAASVRIVRLPGLPPKGDVSDWLAAGHTTAELDWLWELARAVGRFEKRPAAPLPEPRVHDDGWENDFYDMKEARRNRRAIYALPLAPAPKLVLLIANDFAGSYTQGELAEYVGLTTRRLRQIIADLIAKEHMPAHVAARLPIRAGKRKPASGSALREART